MSRTSILQSIKANQPSFVEAPEVENFAPAFDDAVEKYIEVLRGIGGTLHHVESDEQIISIIKAQFAEAKRIVSDLPGMSSIAQTYESGDGHVFEDVDLFIMDSNLAVAENGAVWISDNEIKERVLPFITQHLAVILDKKSIVPTMHVAYDIIAQKDYGFAAFIAGPSKTADIEQSLVLGAHGPKTMTVFLK
ncbi:LUD domain-containing protein [Danxiaibacter flavus]|uniref:LUD domain-containing protein n=1 Tax=Danxiaibacter flavus TaxID=3049108 RepID=A0ABV3ZAF5_9BACT|nr:LUD domain-containing protein [Chitinophagaceae bacterium DXS]